MNICYFGAYETTYPRNRILRAGLRANGARIFECRVPKHWRTVRSIPILAAKYKRIWRECDVILLAEFGQRFAPAAWCLARITNRPLVTDLLISFYDMAVYVRRTARLGSLRARRYYWLDLAAVRLSDAALVDAEPHREHFVQTYGGQRGRLHVVPLGVDEENFRQLPRETPSDARTLVQYYGSFTPAHGVDTIVRAAGHLARRADIQFQFIGDGQDYKAAVSLAERLELTNIRFDHPVPYSELPAHIARATISLGEFGDTPQTRRGLANKVYQTLAMGKPLINGDTPSIRSLFTPDEHLFVCTLADPEALANAICTVADNPDMRARVAIAGQRWTLRKYTSKPLGATLIKILGSLI